MLAIVLWTFAVVLAAFGVLFTATGLNSERGYWSQRDPHGDARRDATKLHVVIAKAWSLATGEARAPLRIAAIGVLLVYLAIAFALVALIVTLVSR